MIRWVLIALVAAFGIVFPHIAGSNYFIHLGIIAMIWMIVATGTNIIQGYTGYVTIAQGGFMGIGAYASALMSLNWGIPVWLALLLAPVATGALALVAGYPALRVRGHYFAIATLAMNMVIFIVLYNWISLTGGEAGMAGIRPPESFSLFGTELNFQRRLPYYYLVLVALGLTMLLVTAVVRSRVGRVLMAIRQNETFAEAAGVACWRYKLFAFVLAAALAGFAGGLYAHYLSFISPRPFSVEASLNAILAVILGGSGTLVGPLVGAAITVTLPEVLRVAEAFRLVFYGVALVVVVIFLPRGLVPFTVDSLRWAVEAMTRMLAGGASAGGTGARRKAQPRSGS